MMHISAPLEMNSKCCQTGCPDCPYGYGERADPNLPSELQNPWKKDPDKKTKEVYEGEVPGDEQL